MTRWIIDTKRPDPQAERECLSHLIRKHPRESRLPLPTLRALLIEAYCEKAQEEFAREEFPEALNSLQGSPGYPCEFLNACMEYIHIVWIGCPIVWEGWSPFRRLDTWCTVEDMLNAIRRYRDELPNPEEYTLRPVELPLDHLVGFTTGDRGWHIQLINIPQGFPYMDLMTQSFADRLWRGEE